MLSKYPGANCTSAFPIPEEFKKLRKKSRQLRQGPRAKDYATQQLEEVIHALLEKTNDVYFTKNDLQEIEAKLNGNSYNITQILKNNPDFSHIELDDTQLANYANFITHRAIYKPQLPKTGDIPTEEAYNNLDAKGDYAHLHYGEKLAITLYTSKRYKVLQHLLHYSTIKPSHHREKEMSLEITEQLLCICVASHGLKKPPTNQNAQDDKQCETLCVRSEVVKPNDDFFIQRITNIQKTTLSKNNGFTSTAANVFLPHALNADNNCFTLYRQPNSSNPLGKYIAPLSVVSEEEELLFPPGTQFQYTDYNVIEGAHVFSCTPVRTIENINPFSYSPAIVIVNEINIIKKSLTNFIPKDALAIIDNLILNGKKETIEKLFQTLLELQSVLRKEIEEDIKQSNTTDEALLNVQIHPLFRLDKLIATIRKKYLPVEDEQKKFRNINIAKIIDAIKKSLKESGLDENLVTADTLKRVQAIQNQCNEQFYDQQFYGNAALNRKMLLDSNIASQLSVYVLLYIYISNNKLQIKRNSTQSTSLADAIYYGFFDGLDTLKYMPNNESKYGISEYEEQKENYENNTKKIINTILQLAERLGVNTNDEIYQEKEEKEKNVTQLFKKIEVAIDQLKQEKKSNELLRVPNFTADQIRDQSKRGFTKLCDTLAVNIQPNLDRTVFVISKPDTLASFTDKFMASVDTALNGSVGHLFYDRVHLEACIEQNTTIQISEVNYQFRDILREIIKKCDAQPDGNIIKEQLSIRLKSVARDLKVRFDFFTHVTMPPDVKQTLTTPSSELINKHLIKCAARELKNHIEFCTEAKSPPSKTNENLAASSSCMPSYTAMTDMMYNQFLFRNSEREARAEHQNQLLKQYNILSFFIKPKVIVHYDDEVTTRLQKIANDYLRNNNHTICFGKSINLQQHLPYNRDYISNLNRSAILTQTVDEILGRINPPRLKPSPL